MTMRHAKPYRSREAAERSAELRTRKGAGELEVVPCSKGCEPGIYHAVRKGKISAAERKPQKDTGPDRATRALVLARDGHACVCCGVSVIGRRYSLQHRKRRSQGGDNSAPNLLTVLGDGTTGCHARIDSRIDPHDEAAGYTVRSHDDPSLVGVLYVSEHGSGVLMYLGADGSLTPDVPAGAVA